LFFKDGDAVKKGDVICRWDPFNAVIVSEYAGTLRFHNVIEGQTYKAETDETSGMTERIIIESKDHNIVPTVDVEDENGEVLGTYNFPVGGHIANIEDGQKITTGETLVRIPRSVFNAGGITGGLPRVQELFEARNPSSPAVVSEIDGEVTMGKLKRGNREIIITSKTW
jgi:DNA-directed RNA polymerase subunit beta'